MLCPECGASVPEGESCLANLHALLFLEWEIPGGPGELAHFYAVASYGLQHPERMGYNVGTVEGLLSVVGQVLAGEMTIAEVRRHTRALAKAAGRITRRTGEPVPHWPVEEWPVLVSDILPGGIDGYGERVERWARSIVATIAEARGHTA